MHYNRGAMFDLHPTGEQVEIRRAFQATNLGIGRAASEAALEFADGE